MNFKIGDSVRFLNEKGEGIVSKIINKTTVGITIEDGFVIPYQISQLVPIHDQTAPQPTIQKNNSSSTTIHTQSIKTETPSAITQKEPDGIYVAFSPDKAELSEADINVWLINNTQYQIMFTYSLFQNGSFITLETGSISNNQSLLIETIDRTELIDFSTFKIEALFFDTEQHEHQAPISESVKLKPIRLYKPNAFIENSLISEKALIMNVCTIGENAQQTSFESKTDLTKLLFQKKHQATQTKKSKPHISNNPAYEMELDLHIEELIENFQGMSNAEIILVQLKHFQLNLDNAINNHYRKLIVIHGVGNGRLKQEVRNILSSYKNLQYFDASYSKYGFGATEIVIH
ncbi:MAG: DUF2027 domain-containing protein [Bacteroidia bacterium]